MRAGAGPAGRLIAAPVPATGFRAVGGRPGDVPALCCMPGGYADAPSGSRLLPCVSYVPDVPWPNTSGRNAAGSWKLGPDGRDQAA